MSDDNEVLKGYGVFEDCRLPERMKEERRGTRCRECVPIAELEALVEEWREKQQHANKKKGERDNKGDYEGMANYAGMEMQAAKCADELEALLAEYGDE